MESESSMSFQKIVLIVAIIALILMLSVIGYMMYYSSQNQQFPPIGAAPRCPDKWKEEGLDCKNDVDAASKMFTNVGSFLTDKLCIRDAISGNTDACTDIVGLYGILSDKICKSPWVQGNVTNGKDPLNCYLLASQGTTPITHYGTASLSIESGGSGYRTHIHTVLLSGSGSGYTTFPTVNLTIKDGVIIGVVIASGATQWVLTTASDTSEHILTVPAINGVGSSGTINATVSSSGSLTLSVNNAGSGYIKKIYPSITLTLSSGAAAAIYPIVDITVTYDTASEGKVTNVSVTTVGLYANTNTKMTATGIGGGGSGFVVELINFVKSPATDITISSTLSYTKDTLEKDVDWAKKYGITWDGYN